MWRKKKDGRWTLMSSFLVVTCRMISHLTALCLRQAQLISSSQRRGGFSLREWGASSFGASRLRTRSWPLDFGSFLPFFLSPVRKTKSSESILVLQTGRGVPFSMKSRVGRLPVCMKIGATSSELTSLYIDPS